MRRRDYKFISVIFVILVIALLIIALKYNAENEVYTEYAYAGISSNSVHYKEVTIRDIGAKYLGNNEYMLSDGNIYSFTDSISRKVNSKYTITISDNGTPEVCEDDIIKYVSRFRRWFR